MLTRNLRYCGTMPTSSRKPLVGRWLRPPRWLKTTLIALAVLMALSAGFDGVIDLVWPTSGTTGRIALLIVAGLIGVVVTILSALLPGDALWHGFNHNLKYVDDSDSWDVSPLPQDTYRSYAQARGRETGSRVKNYGHLLHGLAGRMAHCHEGFKIEPGGTQRTILADFDIPAKIVNALRTNLSPGEDPSKAANTTCFPLLTLLKGSLPGELEVTWEGRRLAVTPFAEVERLQVQTLQSLFDSCFGSSQPRSLFNQALECVTWHGSSMVESADSSKLIAVEKREQDVEHNIARLRNRWRSAVKSLGRKNLLNIEYLVDFIELYSKAYPVCVELPPGALRNSLSLAIVMELPRLEFSSRWRDKLRLWLEIEPFKFRAPLTRMFISRSYHLSVRSHSSQYLFSQRLETAAQGGLTLERITLAQLQREVNQAGRHVRLESFNERGLGRFYSRGFRSSDARRLFLVSQFHERPPGPLGTSASMMVVNLFLLCTFGYFASIRSFPASLNLAAFLLALPALSLSILGRVRGPDASSFMSLRARVGEIIAMVLSLVAVVLYAVEQASVFLPTVRHWSLVGVEVPYDDAWLGLIVVSVACSLYLVASLVASLVSYQRAISQHVNEGEPEVIPRRIPQWLSFAFPASEKPAPSSSSRN